jgi:hypothetical protein
MTTATISLPDEMIDTLAAAVQDKVIAKNLFTTRDLAEHLGVTQRYVRGMGERGCPRHRVGKSDMWLLTEVEAWIAAR